MKNKYIRLLMTKFDKFKKIRLFDLLFRNIQFQQLHSKVKEGAKFEDLKIHGVLKQ
jgi:hypothetical protein